MQNKKKYRVRIKNGCRAVAINMEKVKKIFQPTAEAPGKAKTPVSQDEIDDEINLIQDPPYVKQRKGVPPPSPKNLYLTFAVFRT
jgi:hypothetical protein